MIKDLQYPERKFDLHQWADYVEIACLLNPDLQVSCDSVFKSPNLIDENSETYDFPSESMLSSDLREADVNQIIQGMTRRKTLLQESYPFNIDEHVGFVEVIRTNKDSRVFTYLMLLFASHSKLLPMELKPKFEKDFERICIDAFRNMVGMNYKVVSMGNVDHQDVTRLNGNTFSKLDQLSKILFGKLLVEEAEIPKSSSGDHGIDLIAFYPFDDNASYSSVFFGQCGITESTSEMLSKQDEINPVRINDKIARILPIPVFFTPTCYRSSNGDWPSPSDVRTIFIDRIRLLKLIGPDKANTEYLSNLESFRAVFEYFETITQL